MPWREVAFSPNVGSFTVLPSTTIHHGGGVRLNALPGEKKVIAFFTITTKKRTQALFFSLKSRDVIFGLSREITFFLNHVLTVDFP